MNFELIQASKEHKETLANLMQFYMYDFSEFVKCDVEEDGRFEDDPYLEDYFKEKERNHRFPYVIKKDEKYIGFVLVRFIESVDGNYFSIAEFFVMKKYRREGIGQAVASQVFSLHQGPWEVFQIKTNLPAQVFWNKVINDYTDGVFSDRAENGRRIQNFVS